MGLHMAVAMNVKKPVIGQSKIIIQALKEEPKECPIEIRNCIEDCKALVLQFEFVDFQHVTRSRNNLAHL